MVWKSAWHRLLQLGATSVVKGWEGEEAAAPEGSSVRGMERPTETARCADGTSQGGGPRKASGAAHRESGWKTTTWKR